MSVLQRFFQSSTAPGILLFCAAVLAIVAENSPLQFIYESFKSIPVVLQVGEFKINKPLLLWINDGLMAIFFLLVGLEIKRELLQGHLSSVNQALLPAIAAVGGMIAPAIIYSYINWHDPVTLRGWAIPTATDIAFALGVMMALGDRVPASLKVCLVAIAVIDDLLAIIVIAVFYSHGVSVMLLLMALAGLAFAILLNRMGVTRLSPYVVIGLFVWACVLKSGVHATLAGVALGLIIPLRAENRKGQSPLLMLEHTLQPWVSFGVLPLFAFANAGVSLAGLTLHTFVEPITLGIMLGLFFGKQIGILLVTAAACKLRICKLPEGANWAQYYGMTLLTGIGFTMSLFIGTLAFTDVLYAAEVRLGVLTASTLAGICGSAVLLLTTRPKSGT